MKKLHDTNSIFLFYFALIMRYTNVVVSIPLPAKRTGNVQCVCAKTPKIDKGEMIMEAIKSFVAAVNGFTWGPAMLILVVGSGLFFTFGLKFFQFAHFGDMWSRIIDRQDSDSGISTFASFCTTMAMRIGTGNVAGVAVALYAGGPGAMFWMIIAGMTNSAVCFVETTLASAYKFRMDGQYRGGGPYCAERGLGWKPYGIFLAAFFGLGVGLFMPAAATNSIADGFQNALNIPMWVTSLVVAIITAVTIMGGIKRIGQVASLIVPFMTVIYIIVALITIIMNITRLPAVIGMIFSNAFSANALLGGGIGIAIQQGVKRGTFSSASGMGESSPTAAAAETSHPVKQGMANAAGVWLDTVIVCTCSGFMMLMTDCFDTTFGYHGSGADLSGVSAGVGYVQAAASHVLGGIAPVFIAVMLFLFSFTCLISYFYESETSILYMFQGPEKAGTRKMITRILQIVMPILIFFYGIVPASMAWDLADFALGSCTFFNMLIVLLLSPKAFALYKDYQRQMKAGQDPYYDPDTPGLCWKGIDADMWRDINKKYIAAAKSKKK